MNRFRIGFAALAAAAALGGATAAPAVPAHFAPTAIGKSCSSSYTRAVIGGVQKCLRAGQFCAHRYDSQYRRYGFRCTRYDARVARYRLTHG